MSSLPNVTSPAGHRSEHLHRRPPTSPWPAWPVLAVIVLIRIPFLLLHALQEDAYITLRSARHLAEYGDFSFNFHQHFPGTTSLLYPLFVAAFDLLSPSSMIPFVQVFGSFCVIAACWFLSRALCNDTTEQRIVWLLTACWPIALLMSYNGMETSLLVLVLGTAIFALVRENHATLFAASVLLLPLIRPDAIAYGLLFCAAMFLIDRTAAVCGSLALVAGCGLLLLGTRLTTGRFLPTTARAKEIAYHPGHTLAAVADRTRDLFLSHSFLLPTPTNYLLKLSPFLFILVAAAFALAIRYASSRRERIVLVTLAVAGILIPLAYAYGGVVFAWYLFPANWIATGVAIAVLVRSIFRSRFPRTALALLCVLWIGLVFLQWAKALTAATQDYHYRGDIGRYLATITGGKGTLFLEPAGYIPYYSGLRTDDEIGLVSNRATWFMEHDPARWWFAYVAAEHPDYIVERASFDRYSTIEGYALTADQQRWFNQHYRLLRRFHYVSAAYHPSPFLQKILATGPIEDYLVFVRRDISVQ